MDGSSGKPTSIYKSVFKIISDTVLLWIKITNKNVHIHVTCSPSNVWFRRMNPIVDLRHIADQLPSRANAKFPTTMVDDWRLKCWQTEYSWPVSKQRSFRDKSHRRQRRGWGRVIVCLPKYEKYLFKVSIYCPHLSCISGRPSPFSYTNWNILLHEQQQGMCLPLDLVPCADSEYGHTTRY